MLDYEREILNMAAARRVLILEDQAFFSHLLNVIVTSCGFEVRVARDGETALHLAKTFRPHAVMLDIDMPGMDGLEVLERLRNDHPKGSLPIMMASARGEPSTVARAASLGADGFLRKPYSIDDIVERLERLLHSRASPAEEYLI